MIYSRLISVGEQDEDPVIKKEANAHANILSTNDTNASSVIADTFAYTLLHTWLDILLHVKFLLQTSTTKAAV